MVYSFARPGGLGWLRRTSAVNVSGILGPSTTHLFYLQPAGRLVRNAISLRAGLRAGLALTRRHLRVPPGEVPCVFKTVWGDYDEMMVSNNNTSIPLFLRAFTDSTKAACNAGGSDWSTSTPQHISGGPRGSCVTASGGRATRRG